MIELQKTGWMSNRGRQNVASYWAKEWEQDWRIAAKYFESMLIDYDVHSNYGNWMYLGGVGNDPRPNRAFNLEKQAEYYDPDGTFRKLWLVWDLVQKQNTDGGGDIDDRAPRVGKFSGYLIDAVSSYSIGIRTGGEEPIGIRCEINISWEGSPDGLYLYHF